MRALCDQTSHSSAEPEVVPSEVTTGAPVENPKASLEVPARASAGAPDPSTP